MLNNISWGNYLLVVVLILTGYYAFIGAKFYAPEIKAFLNRKRPKHAHLPEAEESSDTDISGEEEQGFDPFNSQRDF